MGLNLWKDIRNLNPESTGYFDDCPEEIEVNIPGYSLR